MTDIVKPYILDAPRKQIYDAWVSNKTLIAPAVELEIEPFAGGKYLLISQFGDDVSHMEGRFEQVVPYQKLVYSWEWNKDGNQSMVTVLFFDEPEDLTRIEIKHDGFHDQSSADMHSFGWDNYMDGLKDFLSK